MTTLRQKRAVRFCEHWLHIKFDGDIDNYNDVNLFLSKYLDDAKVISEDAIESYYGWNDY